MGGAHSIFHIVNTLSTLATKFLAIFKNRGGEHLLFLKSSDDFTI
nr:MAG TPA: DNA polymerase family B [Bacteriophage sp.]